jgi:DNA-binding transcriptional LysR family regulator
MKINDLNKLFYFKEAAELLNYTKVAQKLQASPSGIQQAVKALEDSLGHKLFIRKSKGLALTQEGKILYDRVTKSFKELNLAEKELASRVPVIIEKLKILTTPGQAAEWIYKCLPLIRQAYPHMIVELLSSNLEICLETDEFDIYVGPKIETSSIYTDISLATISFKIYAGKEYVETNGLPKTIQDLSNHALIKFSGLMQAYFAAANLIFSELDEEQKYLYVIDSYLAEYNLVKENFAIACLCKEFVDAKDDGLIDVFPHMAPIVVPIHMYYRKNLQRDAVNIIHNVLRETTIYPLVTQIVQF